MKRKMGLLLGIITSALIIISFRQTHHAIATHEIIKVFREIILINKEDKGAPDSEIR
jgi:hypothetical protein